MQESTNTISVEDWTYSGVHVFEHYLRFSPKTNKFSKSIAFKHDENGVYSEWSIEMHYLGFGEQFHWTLELIDCNQSELRAVFKIYAKNSICILTSVAAVAKPHSFHETKKICIRSHINPDIKKFCSALPDRVSYIHCTIGVLESNSIMKRKITVSNPYPAVLSEMNLGKIFQNGRCSDVTVVVGDREFQTHKAILTAFSDVFAAMFEHPLEEAKTNRIEITDIQPDVFQELLHLMYTHKAPNLKEMVKDVLMAADKYALPPALIEMCENELIQDVDVDVAAEILVIADLCNAHRLKNHVLEFINLNGKLVMQTEGWKNLVKMHNHLVLELLEADFKSLRKME